jgi:ribose 5-phosphate isomerase RpiB
MLIGIAADDGGFELKEDLQRRLTTAGHDIVDFGANRLEQERKQCPRRQYEYHHKSHRKSKRR